LLLRLGFGEDVEDLLQDVFVSLLGSIHRIRKPDSLRPFVLAIAATRAHVEVRRKQKRRFTVLATAGDLPEVSTPPADFDARQALLSVLRALERMPPRVRLGYCLAHLSGLQLTEIARTLDVSRSTVKRAVSRARKHLVRFAPPAPSATRGAA
jgi:RNA polymerase sigma-70 factor (ECF subfamily)